MKICLERYWHNIMVKLRNKHFFLSNKSVVNLILGVLDGSAYHRNDLVREGRVRKCRLLALVLINTAFIRGRCDFSWPFHLFFFFPLHATSRDLCLLLPSSERPRRRSDVTCATRKWTRRSTASSQREVSSVAPACPLHPGAAAAAPGLATQSNTADSWRSRVQGMGRGLWDRRHVALRPCCCSYCCRGPGGLGGVSWMLLIGEQWMLGFAEGFPREMLIQGMYVNCFR